MAKNRFRAIAQSLLPNKDREVWLSLAENHVSVFASVDIDCENARSASSGSLSWQATWARTSSDRFPVKRLPKLHFLSVRQRLQRPNAALRKNFRVTQLGKAVNRGRVTSRAQKGHFRFIQNDIRCSWNIAEVPPHDSTCL